MRALALVLGLTCMVGCADGTGVVVVTVSATGGTVAGVSQFRVTVTNAGATSKPSLLPVPAAPVSLPPSQTLSLSLGADRKGSITVSVDALDAKSNVLASGMGMGDVEPSQVTQVAVDLTGVVEKGDMSTSGDMAKSVDFAGVPDMAQDFSQPMITWDELNSGVTNDFTAIWGSGAKDIFVVGSKGKIVHSADNGATWQTQPTNTLMDFSAVWGSGGGDVYAVGVQGMIAHTIDGGMNWSLKTQGGQPLYGVTGTSASDVFVVGGSGEIYHSADKGMTWQTQTSGTQQSLNGIFPGPIVVGTNGTIMVTMNGGMWTPVTSGSMANLTAIWASGPGDIYAVGYNGTTLHSTDGMALTWVNANAGGQGDLNAVWGSGPDAVYIVGGLAAIITSFDGGKSWQQQNVNGGGYFTGVWGSSSTDVYVVGRMGKIFHRH